MAFGCLLLALLMAGGLVWRSAQSIVTPYVIEVDQAGQVRTVGEAATQYRPADAQIAFHLAHFVTLVRSLSIDPIVVRQNWLDAYDYTTDKGAAVLNDYARTNDPFARIGRESVTVQITSVVRASGTSFNVRWTERRYVNGAAAGLERWTAVVSIVLQTPRTEERLRRNPWVSTSMVCRGAANLKPRKERSHESTSTTQCRRTVARPSAQPARADFSNEYRQRLRDGIALAWPLFAPGLRLDERTLNTVCLLTLLTALSGCATQGKPPPTISLDEPVQAQPLPEPPTPVEVVEVPQVLPMPAQMKPLPEVDEAKPAPEPADETVRVSKANAEARIAPTREGYVNAIQVWPFTDGALYQVYAAPGRVTVVSLQPGEELVTVAAGDTVRWIVGDTSSGSGDALRVNVLVKPIRSGLKTNLVITTSRRTYLLELTSTQKAWMASVSWDYPKDRMLALRRQAQAASAAAPVDTGLSLEKIRFRYAVSGSNPPWKPLRLR